MRRHNDHRYLWAIVALVWVATICVMAQNVRDMERLGHQVDRLNERTRALNMALAHDADKLQATEAREKTVTDLYLNTLLPDGGAR